MLHFFLFSQNYLPVFSSLRDFQDYKRHHESYFPLVEDFILEHKEGQPCVLKVTFFSPEPSVSSEEKPSPFGRLQDFQGALYYEHNEDHENKEGQILRPLFCGKPLETYCLQGEERIIVHFQALPAHGQEDFEAILDALQQNPKTQKVQGEFLDESRESLQGEEGHNFSLIPELQDNKEALLKTRPYIPYWSPLGDKVSLSHGFYGEEVRLPGGLLFKKSLKVHKKQPLHKVSVHLSLQWTEGKKGFIDLGQSLKKYLSQGGKTLETYSPESFVKQWPTLGQFLQKDYWIFHSRLQEVNKTQVPFALHLPSSLVENNEDFFPQEVFSTSSEKKNSPKNKEKFLSPLEFFYEHRETRGLQESSEDSEEREKQKEQKEEKKTTQTLFFEKTSYTYELLVAYHLQRQRLDRAQVIVEAPKTQKTQEKLKDSSFSSHDSHEGSRLDSHDPSPYDSYEQEHHVSLVLQKPEDPKDYPLMMLGEFYNKEQRAWHKGRLYEAQEAHILWEFPPEDSDNPPVDNFPFQVPFEKEGPKEEMREDNKSEEDKEFFKEDYSPPSSLWKEVSSEGLPSGYFFHQDKGKLALDYAYLRAQNLLFWSHRCIFITFSMDLEYCSFLTLDHHVVLEDVALRGLDVHYEKGSFFRGKVTELVVTKDHSMTITLGGFTTDKESQCFFQKPKGQRIYNLFHQEKEEEKSKNKEVLPINHQDRFKALEQWEETEGGVDHPLLLGFHLHQEAKKQESFLQKALENFVEETTKHTKKENAKNPKDQKSKATSAKSSGISQESSPNLNLKLSSSSWADFWKKSREHQGSFDTRLFFLLASQQEPSFVEEKIIYRTALKATY